MNEKQLEYLERIRQLAELLKADALEKTVAVAILDNVKFIKNEEEKK